MHSNPTGLRLSRGRSLRCLLATVLAASGLALVAVTPSGAQVTEPVVSGEPCALGEGVTVVVDFTDEPGDADIVVGCAPGEQATGFDAVTAAGFPHEVDHSGFLCQVQGVPSSGTPCDPQGFWSSWDLSEGTWAFASTGLDSGPVEVDSIMGLSWVSDWATIEAAPPRTIIELADENTSTTTSTTAPTTTTSTSTTVPEPGGCSIARTADRGVEAALDWLGCELEGNDHVMPGYEGSVNWGLTADVILAQVTYGRAQHQVTTRALANLEASILSYVTGADFGSPEDWYAGALGKALLTVAVAGGDPGDFGGLDLRGALLDRMVTTGDDAGRFSDQSEWGDYSNGLGQALGMIGLVRTGGVPADSVDFLLAQQCPAGGFRGDYSVPGGCTDDDAADIDYSAIALLALLELPSSPDVQAAIDETVSWLLSRQQPSGAFTGTGITATENTNSTGLVAMALRWVGETDAADRARAYVESAQITPASTDVAVLAAGPATDNVGAIAYDPATLAEAVAEGISTGGLQQWHMATSQAVYAFGATSFGVAQDPVEDPGSTTTAPVPAPVEDPLVPAGPVSGSGGQMGPSGRSAPLPATGSDSSALVAWGIGLLAAGAAVVALERSRRRRLIEDGTR